MASYASPVEAGQQMGLLERELELGTAEDWLERVQAARGGRVLVEGPAGIGKSAVLEALIERAGMRGMLCLFASASEVAAQVAFGVARTALGVSWPEDAQDPDVELQDEAPAPSTVRDAVRITLELAEQQPVLVAIDDVQWADAASLRWLSLLAARAASVPVGLALAVRTGADGAEGATLDELLDDRDAVVIRPAPLSVPAACELISLRLAQPVDDALSVICHAETGGNPYLLLALADALRQAGIPEGPGTRERVREIGARAVSRSVVRRLDRLDPAARRLVEALAVLGTIGDPSDLAAVAGVPALAAAEAAERLVELDLLASAGELEITHPLVAAVVRAETSPARRAELARRAARRLRAAGKVEEAAARLADLPPQADAEVVQQLAEAAQKAAARGAPDVAATLLRRALAEPAPEVMRGSLRAMLGRVLLASGDPAAVDVLREAQREAPPGTAEAGSVAAALAMALNYARRPNEAAAVLDQARAQLAGGDAALAEELEAQTIHYLSFDPAQRSERARRLARVRDRRGESELAYRMRLAEMASDAVVEGRPAAEAVSLAERALAAGVLLSHEFSAFAKAVLALAYAGKPAAAHVQLQDAAAHARRRGDTVTLGFALALQGEASRLEGDMLAVEADTRTGLDLLPPSELGPRFMLRGLIESLVEQGRVGEAETELRAGELTGELAPVLPTPGLLHCRALVRIAAGATALGVEDLLRAGDLAEQLRLRDPLSVPWRLAAAEALITLDDRARASALLEEHLRLARAKGLPEAIGPALRVKAALTGGPERLVELAKAVELLEGGFARLELARALVDLGTASWNADRSRARSWLERGARMAEQLGARVLGTRAAELLAPDAARDAFASADDPMGLSPTERRVVRLSAEGMSTQEIAQTLVLTERAVASQLATAAHKLSTHPRSVQVRPQQDRDRLTQRELDVLRLLVSSLSMRDIAAELYVTHNTLKTHCKSLYRKLDVTSREEAVARGRASGLLR